MSNFKQTNKKLEDAVVNGYKKIEAGVLDGYKKIEDKFIETFLAEDGESAEDARTRITGSENKEQAEGSGKTL